MQMQSAAAQAWCGHRPHVTQQYNTLSNLPCHPPESGKELELIPSLNNTTVSASEAAEVQMQLCVAVSLVCSALVPALCDEQTPSGYHRSGSVCSELYLH